MYKYIQGHENVNACILYILIQDLLYIFVYEWNLKTKINKNQHQSELAQPSGTNRHIHARPHLYIELYSTVYT